MRGIKARLVWSYLIVILITMFILEAFLIFTVRQYYYQNVVAIITNQAKVSANFYSRYLGSGDLEAQSKDLLESFVMNSSAQVQIINSDGQLIQDSAGIEAAKQLNSPDIVKALQGKVGLWEGQSTANESIMSVAYPLMAGEQVVGAVRFVTSLETTNRVILIISTVLIGTGLIVIAIALVASVLSSRTITIPVKELTSAAEMMAKGNFTVRAGKRYNDELGKLADTLNFMASEILRNDRLQNEFISSVSHELRTPLTSIKGWAITLKSDLCHKEIVRDGLEIIEQESDRLADLVEELLDFSKFEAGRVTLRLNDVDVNALLQYIEKQTAPRANRKGVHFNVTAGAEIPTLQADENRLKQVLINVVDNAIKFTNDGGRIEVHAEKADGHVMISVRDDGAGIAEEELLYVTQKFSKGNNKSAGSGLGLAIAQDIMKLHGGSLHIRSTLGEGTTVELLLPL